MLAISCLGILYRALRLLSPSFSKMLLLRKVHGPQLNGIIMSSGECFVLELILDNLTNTPMFIDSVLTEVAANMKAVSYRRSTKDSYRNYIFNYHEDVEDSTLLLKEEGNHQLESTKLSPVLPELKFETDQDSRAASCTNTDNKACCNDDKMKTLTPNEDDILIDLQEEAKPTSKKKKNKKNQKVTNTDCEDRKNEKKKLEHEASAGGSVVVEVEKVVEVEADSTVVSFLEDSHHSQDWL